MASPSCRIDFCSHNAVRYAVGRWHYSRRIPFGKTVGFGVWEDERFVGVVTFGYSATPNVAKGLRMKQQQVVELTRVALSAHRTPVSRIVAICIRLLQRQSPGLRVVVSFADADQGHHGGIYQAGNWIYTGLSMAGVRNGYIVRGAFMHCRSAGMKGRNTLEWVRANLDPTAVEHLTKGKHRYLMPLDPAMRAALLPLRQPYPKRDVEQIAA